MKAGAPEDDPPDVTGLQALIVRPNGRIFLFESRRHGLVPVEDGYHAIGTGMAIALGALYAKASAAVAVKAAIKHDRNTGGKVQTIRLKKKQP
jgi:hypothetical protein